MFELFFSNFFNLLICFKSNYQYEIEMGDKIEKIVEEIEDEKFVIEEEIE